jgi:hypothetical protein
MSEPLASSSGPSRSGDAVEQNGSSSVASGSRTAYGKEATSSFIARSGFPLLATSSYLVQEISQEVEALLVSFTAAWTAAADQAKTSGCEDLPSPFAIFKDIYVERGWHLYQMHWSEHQETRSGIYTSFVRVLTGESPPTFQVLKDTELIESSSADYLRPLLPLLSISTDGTIRLNDTSLHKVPTVEVLKGMGVLFALKLIQSTTSVNVDISSRRTALRIPIEVDLYYVLALLPLIAQKSKALGDWIESQRLQPIDDVVFILKDMKGELDMEKKDGDNSDTSSEESEDATQEKRSGVFEMLVPTTYDARGALINNCLSTKGEIEKKEGTWGRLRTSEAAQDGIGMSRADLMRNLVRQRLDLPLRSGEKEVTSTANGLVMNPFKIERRGRSKDDVPVMIPPSMKAEDDLQECRDDVVQQRETYEGAKRQRVDGVEFASLLPSLINSTTQTATSVGPADLQPILAVARENVVHAMRKSMAGQRRSKRS